VRGFIGRGEDVAGAAAAVDFCVIATPDHVVAEVSGAIVPEEDVVVVHLSGALGLDVLASHRRRASVHPLVSLASPETGAAALTAGAWFAVAGDPAVRTVVADLGGRLVEVADRDRAAYHAAACIASNHTVALLAQVARVAAAAGVPLDAYLDLVRATVHNVATLGPAAALTGPVARGDWATVQRHLSALAAIDPAEVGEYRVLAEAAARLADQQWPPTLGSPPLGSPPLGSPPLEVSACS
jgi:predicted short-subunit dehydrogenase-like oxidoreductase (DUF2520 family)